MDIKCIGKAKIELTNEELKALVVCAKIFSNFDGLMDTKSKFALTEDSHRVYNYKEIGLIAEFFNQLDDECDGFIEITTGEED